MELVLHEPRSTNVVVLAEWRRERRQGALPATEAAPGTLEAMHGLAASRGEGLHPALRQDGRHRVGGQAGEAATVVAFPARPTSVVRDD